MQGSETARKKYAGKHLTRSERSRTSPLGETPPVRLTSSSSSSSMSRKTTSRVSVYVPLDVRLLLAMRMSCPAVGTGALSEEWEYLHTPGP